MLRFDGCRVIGAGAVQARREPGQTTVSTCPAALVLGFDLLPRIKQITRRSCTGRTGRPLPSAGTSNDQGDPVGPDRAELRHADLATRGGQRSVRHCRASGRPATDRQPDRCWAVGEVHHRRYLRPIVVVHDQSPAFHFGTPPNWTPQERPAAAIMVASRLDRPKACGLQLASLFVLGLLASIAWHEAGHLLFRGRRGGDLRRRPADRRCRPLTCGEPPANGAGQQGR